MMLPTMEIKVIVKGGAVVHVENVPPCCRLNVYDYDVRDDDTDHDKDGVPCYKYEW